MDIYYEKLRSCLVESAAYLEFTETAYLMVLMAPFWLLLAVTIAPLILYRYRKAVERFMNQQAYVTSLESIHFAANQDFQHSRRNAPTGIASAVHLRQSHSRSLVLVIALPYLLFLSIPIMLSQQLEGRADFAETMAGCILLLAMLALPLLKMLYHTHKYAIRGWCVIILIFVLFLLYEAAYANSREDYEDLLYGLILLLYMMVFYIGLCGQKLKNIVPYATVAIAFAAMLNFLLIVTVYSIGCGLNVNYESALFVIAILFAFIIGCIVLPLFGIRFVSKLYSAKKFSDTQLTMCCWFIVATLSAMCMMQVPDEDSVELMPIAWTVIPALLIVLTLYLQYSRRSPLVENPPSLLVLRVFSESKSAHQVIEQIIHTWRQIGPAHMIAGPDLARSSAEPDELYLYLTRRLNSLFIKNQSDCDSALSQLDTSADPDGTYRLNEYFCFDNVWERIANGLIQQTDYLLLDLRGFTVSRLGTAKEIVFLSEQKALPRALILVESEQKTKEMIDNIKKLTGVTISADQILSLEQADQDNMVSQLLKLDDLNVGDSYLVDELARDSQLTDKSYQDQQLFEQHQNTVEKHRATNYSFNYLLMFLGVFVMFVGYGTQLIAPFYLKLRGVSWLRCFKVTGLLLLFSVSFAILDELVLIQGVETLSTQDTVQILVIVIAMLGAFIAAWIPISKRANRWIAESKEPTKSALAYLRKHQGRP